MSKKKTTPNETITNPGDMDQLRDILFGNQARSLDQRLNEMEVTIETLRRDLTNQVKQQVGSLSETGATDLTNARRELTSQIEQQATTQSEQLHTTRQSLTDQINTQGKQQSSQLQSAQKQLQETINKLTTDLQKQTANTQKELSNRLDQLDTTLSERLLKMQNESRQRDDDLRQELLALGAWLDDKKTSRQSLADMLIEVGQRLQDGDNGPVAVAVEQE